MSILITGGGGFTGRNLVEFFSDKKYSVLHPGRQELDLTNPAAVRDYLKNNQIETIIHAATVSRDGTNYPPDTCERNLRMFFNLLKYKRPSVKLINLGSGSEYARKHWRKKMPEEYFDTHVPEDGHSYSKYLISKYIAEKCADDVICLRIFGLYGRHENYRFKFIANAIVKNILGLPIVINQNVVYDYMCVSDFCRIVEHYVRNSSRYRILNATTTDSVDLVSLANLVNKAGNKTGEIRVLNPGIGVEYSGDNGKLLSEMGDFNFTPHETAIAELYGHYSAMKDTFDVEAIEKDAYLNYARKLHDDYFKSRDAEPAE